MNLPWGQGMRPVLRAGEWRWGIQAKFLILLQHYCVTCGFIWELGSSAPLKLGPVTSVGLSFPSTKRTKDTFLFTAVLWGIIFVRLPLTIERKCLLVQKYELPASITGFNSTFQGSPVKGGARKVPWERDYPAVWDRYWMSSPFILLKKSMPRNSPAT